MRNLSIVSAALIFSCCSIFSMTPDFALQRLVDGNTRYVSDKLEHPDRTSVRREAIASKQKPFAIVLGCSDSRVAPEILFDQGIGDLFVVRVAGNVVGPIEIDSIEYSAKYLGSNLIVVLGHENCGAVQAVLQGNTQDIEAIAAKIEPVISGCKSSKAPLQSCVQANVRSVVTQIKKYPKIDYLITQGKIKVVGAYYSLNTGKVEILP